MHPPDTYSAHDADQPELYARLMEERYGPLRAIFAEQHRPEPLPAPKPRARRHSTRWPDPKAAHHRALLLIGLNAHRQRTATP